MKISFVVLAHQNPHVLQRLVGTLLGAGHTVAVHYDLKAGNAGFQELQGAFAGRSDIRFARRVKVEWGEWSIVQATLNCLDEIERAGWAPDYVYYCSGADYPIRSAEELSAFLERHAGMEFIEGVPADRERWVKGGPQEDRYRYRFWFNWRSQHRLAVFFLDLQKRLGLRRKFVLGLEPFIGSQWWVLTWPTLLSVMAMARRRDVRRFFRTTMIPDELFFQTLVCNQVPASRIIGRPLTLYQFTDYLVPIIFCLDRVDYLIRQPFFMARKISPHRIEIFDRLDEVWAAPASGLTLDGDEVATVSPEYETHRLRYRHGVPGAPVYGQKGHPWFQDLARLELPYFMVIGLSLVELKIAQRLLACSRQMICHGQIFHPDFLEFAEDAPEFAGYRRESVVLRENSPPNFLANLVRAQPETRSGFLLRVGQGGDVAEMVSNLPTPAMLVLRGDPLIAFAESLQGELPGGQGRIDWNLIEAMPPALLARQWRKFLAKFQARLSELDRLVAIGMARKEEAVPRWLCEANFDVTQYSLMHVTKVARGASHFAGWSEMVLERWQDWTICAGKILDPKLPNTIPAATSREVATILAGLETGRKWLIGALAAGGVVLEAGYDPEDAGTDLASWALLDEEEI
jgi:hypothetical protein